MVELRGFEPLTFCMPCMPVSSDGVALGPVAAGESGFNVWGRLVRSGEACGRWDLVWSWFAGTSRSKGSSTMEIRIMGDPMTLMIDNCVAVIWLLCRHVAEGELSVRLVR
jgi:hypothetical protein